MTTNYTEILTHILEGIKLWKNWFIVSCAHIGHLI